MKHRVFTGLLSILLCACLVSAEEINFQPMLFSLKGQEVVVEFHAEHLSTFTDLEDVKQFSDYEKQIYRTVYLVPLVKYLFGPLTYRALGGIKAVLSLSIAWDRAYLQNGRVVLPYDYKGLWLIDNEVLNSGKLVLPVPKNEKILFSSKWKKCTDSEREHQTEGFYWYFWDPDRRGCDHTNNVHYQLVNVQFRERTQYTQVTYPEYKRMLHATDAGPTLTATFAFGYIQDLARPSPDTDTDEGVDQYRLFLRELTKLLPSNYSSTDILLKDYSDKTLTPFLVIGKKFQFKKSGVTYLIKVVVNAGIDQMDLFARSFAHDHDSYFAWLGHSRVGSGFDAQIFRQMLVSKPQFYTLTDQYQLVFWGGCNSYSYYTEPFFKLKADMNFADDPNGSKSLDIVANVLPSLFILNARNALVHLQALLNLDQPTSYQRIIRAMEAQAAAAGVQTLAVVLGDEDNEAIHD